MMMNFQNINIEVSQCQLMILGDNLDGKTSVIKGLLRQYEFSQFSKQMPFYNVQKEITANKERVNLHLWDINTNLQLQEFESLIKEIIRLQKGFIMVFDVNNENSLRNLTKWYRIILETTLLEDSNQKIYLLSTDCYQYQNGYNTLSKKDIQDWIEDYEVTKYIEVSRDNIYSMNYPYFKKLIGQIIKHISVYGDH
ncbi:hypothetical protein ABPG74_007189 [Tetrahymena malaccensis]